MIDKHKHFLKIYHEKGRKVLRKLHYKNSLHRSDGGPGKLY